MKHTSPIQNPQSIQLIDETAQLAFAAKLAVIAEAGMVVLLQGDLGAGKTTFVRGFLQALGFDGVVKSPTYTLVEPYQIGQQAVYHFDLYRLAEAEELEYAGGRDYFDGQSICLIEWPEKAEGYLPQADFIIQLQYADPGRLLYLQAISDSAKKAMLRLFPD